MRQYLSAFLLLLAAPLPAAGPVILPLRQQARVIDATLAERLDMIVPRIMRENHADMWILVAREYLEDPVVSTMLDGRSLRARRRTILVFFDPGGGKPVERLTVSRYGLAGLFAPTWDPAREPDQWRALGALVAARDPKRIVVNVSPLTAFGEGLTASQQRELMAALPAAYRARVVESEALAVGWLETRSPSELERYPGIVAIAHGIIAEAFAAIRPGTTTAEDVQWWQRERIRALGLDTWFHPSVAIFRQGAAGPLEGGETIRPGDLLWTDFGITYLRLNTDKQQLAYVLKPGETGAPAGLRAGLAAANRAQDMLLATFRPGATGNAMLAGTRAAAKAAGLEVTIYSHPLGSTATPPDRPSACGTTSRPVRGASTRWRRTPPGRSSSTSACPCGSGKGSRSRSAWRRTGGGTAIASAGWTAGRRSCTSCVDPGEVTGRVCASICAHVSPLEPGAGAAPPGRHARDHGRIHPAQKQCRP